MMNTSLLGGKNWMLINHDKYIQEALKTIDLTPLTEDAWFYLSLT